MMKTITEWHLNRNKARNRGFRKKKVGIHGKRGIFTITKLLIGLALFSLFVAVIGGVYYSMATTYDVPVSDKYSTSYNKLGAISNKTTAIGEQYQGGKLTDTNTLVLAGSSIYSAGQIMLNAVTLPIELINQATADLPFIPRIFIVTLITILVLSVTYAVGSLFARWFF